MKNWLVAVAAAMSASAAFAQAWPQQSVTLVVPFPPGGSTDQVARAVSPVLAEKLKQSFPVDNKPGATGTIGAGLVKRAAPDGSTFLVTSLGPLVIVPHLMKDMQYDPLKDFDLVTVAVQSPNVLVVPANSPYKSVADIIAFQKANPGKMTFASAGNGTSDHLTAELFWQETGTKGVHVPYKGGAPALTGLLGGEVDAIFDVVTNTVAQHRAGRLRILAVTGAQRSPLLPEVAVFRESGLGLREIDEATLWYGFFAPAGTPAATVERQNREIARVVSDAALRERLDALDIAPAAPEPAAFARFVREDSERWGTVIRATGFKVTD